MCLLCGKYGHSKATCHTRRSIVGEEKEASQSKEAETSKSTSTGKEEEHAGTAFGPWMVAQKNYH